MPPHHEIKLTCPLPTSAPPVPAPCSAVADGRDWPRRAASTCAWLSGVKNSGLSPNQRRAPAPASGRHWKQGAGALAAVVAERRAYAWKGVMVVVGWVG